MAATITVKDRFKDISFKQTAATNTGDFDIFDGPCTLYALDINNAAGEDAHYKLYDAVGATYATRPVVAFFINAGERRSLYLGSGLRFGVGLTIRCTDAEMKHDSSDGDTPASNTIIVHVKEG